MQVNLKNASHLDDVDSTERKARLRSMSEQIWLEGVIQKTPNGDGTVNLRAHPLLEEFLRRAKTHPDDAACLIHRED